MAVTTIDVLVTALTQVEQHAQDRIHSGEPMDAYWVSHQVSYALEVATSDANMARLAQGLVDAHMVRALFKKPGSA